MRVRRTIENGVSFQVVPLGLQHTEMKISILEITKYKVERLQRVDLHCHSWDRE